MKLLFFSNRHFCVDTFVALKDSALGTLCSTGVSTIGRR